MKNNTHKLRNLLCLGASSLAAALLTASGEAATYTLSSANSPFSIQTGLADTVQISSGSTAYLSAGYDTVPTGDLSLTWSSTGSFSATGSCTYGGCVTNTDKISVAKGATLYIANPWGWQVYDGMLQVSGNAIVDHGNTYIVGANSFLGNLTLLDGSNVHFGDTWGAPSPITFGTDTNIIMQGTSSIYMRLTSGFTTTMGGALSGGTGASFELVQGTLVINGQNTAATPFLGTFNLDKGATLMIGDATHSTAIFGDPNHTDGSTQTLNLSRTTGASALLSGYGTIYATVNNSGIVKPGGISGSLGTLTVSKYTQSSTGTLEVEISPTGSSELKVLGNANLSGSLIITVDNGTYGNGVYQVLSAGSVTGSFSSISTSGNVNGAIVGMLANNSGFALVTEKASEAQGYGHTVYANRSAVNSFTRAVYDQINTGVQTGKDGDARIWLQPFGRTDDVGRGGNGYNATSGGMMGGAEYKLPVWNAIVGGAFAYTHSSMDVKDANADISSDAFNIAMYGGADVQYGRVDGMFFYNGYDMTSKRKLGEYGTAKMSPSGWSYGLSLQLSRNLYNDLLTPYVRAIYSKNHLDDATEKGSETFSLKYASYNQNAFVGDLGVKLHLLHPTKETPVGLDINVAVAHDFSTMQEKVIGGFADITGSSFTYVWRGNSANALIVGTEFSDQIIDHLEIYGRLNGQFTTNQRSGEISVGGRYRF